MTATSCEKRPDQREVVRDEEEAEMELALQLREHVDDRGLYGDVERGRDFVADEELWLRDERAGDRHALTLSARQLVWVTLEARRGELHPLEGRPDSSATIRTRPRRRSDAGAAR